MHEKKKYFGLMFIMVVLISTNMTLGYMPLVELVDEQTGKITSYNRTEPYRTYHNKNHRTFLHGAKKHKAPWPSKFGALGDTLHYLEYLKPRNISDLVFHYYTPFNESWMNYTPNLEISKAYLIADALYNTYQDQKTTKYAHSLFTITYLAYTFRNQTYIQEAENYWDWLWENGVVNHTTYFMLLKSGSKSARPDVEMWCLYWLWKLTGKQKFHGNLTNLCQNYEYYVLKKIGYPLSTTLKTTLLMNSSGEYIIDVNNGSYEISTWASSMRSILIFFSERGYFNKTLVAECLNRLLLLLRKSAYTDGSDTWYILYEGTKTYIYNNSGVYSYDIKTYVYTGFPYRQHTQRISAFIWANRTLFNHNVSYTLKHLYFIDRYYNKATKTFRYNTPWGLLEQYGIAIAFASWLTDTQPVGYYLNQTIISTALNHSIAQGLIGGGYPLGWYIGHKVSIQHSRKMDANILLGKYESRSDSPDWKVYVNVYLYYLLEIMAWLSKNFWVIHNPHFYYATEILYSKAVQGSPPKYYGISRDSWTMTQGFAQRHGYNLFVLYDGAHPNLTFTDIILAESHSFANLYVVTYSPWGSSALGYGNFSVILRNIRVPLDRTSFIFIPSKEYHIKAVRVSNHSYSSTFVIGPDNYTVVMDTSGNTFVVSALPDNVIVFNPIGIADNNSITVFNITVDMIQHSKDPYWDTYESWYNVTYSRQISYAYWLCYTNDPRNISSLDPNADYDNDGVPTKYEVLFMTNPFKNDTDGDGICDSEEIYFFMDPVSRDMDCDGLTDYFELIGVLHWSKYIPHELNPRNPKSYNSTYYDFFYGYVVENQTPNLSKWDEFNFDEESFRCSLDTDEDSYSNYEEYYITHTDPFEPNEPPSIYI